MRCDEVGGGGREVCGWGIVYEEGIREEQEGEGRGGGGMSRGGLKVNKTGWLIGLRCMYIRSLYEIWRMLKSDFVVPAADAGRSVIEGIPNQKLKDMK